MMKDDAAETAKKTRQKNETASMLSDKGAALRRCYGPIGISAVAAAARYQGGAKNPADAAGSSQWHDRPPARRPRSALPV
jgi:hypothetical protein